MSDVEPMDCFFISPMGEPESDARRNSNTVLTTLLRPRLERHGYRVRRSDHIQNIGRIDDQMIDQLADADLAVCDLTGVNPNVMYELGIRHAIGKPVIVIATKATALPFDAATFRTITYDFQDPMRMHEAGEEIEEAVRLLQEGRGSSNPVSDRIGRKALESSSGVVEESLARIERMVYNTSRLIESRDEDLRMARFAMRIERFDEARDTFQRVLDREPDNREAYIGLARAFRQLKNLDGAIATIEELLTREPRFPRALYNFSCYLALAGRPVDAVVEALSRAIDADHNYVSFASTDPDFDSVREHPSFVGRMAQTPAGS